MNPFNYKKLTVWQKSIELLRPVYAICNQLPQIEEYNLKNQLRRAAISISSNIAEGSGRNSSPDQRRFYEIARSSVIEVDSQLEACIELSYLNYKDIEEVCNILLELYKMLSRLIEINRKQS